MQLQIKDMLLFKYLFEEKYIHRDLIKKYLYNRKYEDGYNMNYKDFRLSQLKKNDFIYAKPAPLGNTKEEVIFPTEKALFFYDAKFEYFKNRLKKRNNSKLKVFEPRKYKLYDELDISESVHKKYITECRFLMENLGIDEWRNELFYYNKYKKNPDAIFRISKYTYALEFEYTFKNKRRYNGVIQRYDRIDKDKIGFDYIIYLTPKDHVYNKLKNIFEIRKVPQVKTKWYNKYYLLKFSDLENNKFTMKNYATGDTLEYTSRIKKYVAQKRRGGLID